MLINDWKWEKGENLEFDNVLRGTLINRLRSAPLSLFWLFLQKLPTFFHVFLSCEIRVGICALVETGIGSCKQEQSRERNCSLRLTHLCVDFSPKLVSHFLSLKIHNGFRNASKFYESWGCIYVAFLWWKLWKYLTPSFSQYLLFV